MSDSSNQHQNRSSSNSPSNSEEIKPKKETVDVRELVYKGGYDKDPQEILGNPAVAPPMIDEGRDLRGDLYREAEDTTSIPEEEKRPESAID
jgi:hypothetical protein